MAEIKSLNLDKDSGHLGENKKDNTIMKLQETFDGKVTQYKDNLLKSPEDLFVKLTQCSEELPFCSSQTPAPLEWLVYAENCKQDYTLLSSGDQPNKFEIFHGNHQVLGTEDIARIVSDQNATILYYSCLDSALLLWILQPGEDNVKFYLTNAQLLAQQIAKCCMEIKDCLNRRMLLSSSEARAIPSRHLQTIPLNCPRNGHAKFPDGHPIPTDGCIPALRRLYDLLVAPAQDVIDNLGAGCHLIVIPDEKLWFCPFEGLLNQKSEPLSERFYISYLPSLWFLAQVINNEKNCKRLEVDLELQRRLSKHGALPTFLHQNTAELERKPQISNKKNSVNKVITSADLIATPADMVRTQADMVRTEPDKALAPLTFSTFTSNTRTGTDVTSSTLVVPHFQQISDKKTALVFGCPCINRRLTILGQEWAPGYQLSQAHRELLLVGRCLSTCPVMGDLATKWELLDQLPSAEIVHIATWASLDDGLLLVSPHPLISGRDESSYLVTVSEILSLQLRAKLVVLSTCGLSPTLADQKYSMKLVNAFLLAGAQSVLVCLWPVPDDLLRKFMVAFYLSLETGEFVSRALFTGRNTVQGDVRSNHMCYWPCFTLVGKDTWINISDIKSSQLDQTIDKCEEFLESQTEQPLLNPRKLTSESKSVHCTVLQQHIKHLLLEDFRRPETLPELIELLNTAILQLKTRDDNNQPYLPICLAESIRQSERAVSLLVWLGFHFYSPADCQPHNLFVIFPYQDTHKMIKPAYQVLKTLKELGCNNQTAVAVYDVLPLKQDTISDLIDLIFLTQHRPEIEIRVTDKSVRPLWVCSKIKAMLSSLGFRQTGSQLCCSLANSDKQLLKFILRILLFFSCHKKPDMLEKFDINMLGRSSEKPPIAKSLVSLRPVLLPRNELRTTQPWMSVSVGKEETEEKMKLANSILKWNKTCLQDSKQAQFWFQNSLIVEANRSLNTFGKHKEKLTGNVKVQPGSSLSHRRVPVVEDTVLTLTDISRRRDHAHLILQDRLKKVKQRRQDGILQLYLPYIESNYTQY